MDRKEWDIQQKRVSTYVTLSEEITRLAKFEDILLGISGNASEVAPIVFLEFRGRDKDKVTFKDFPATDWDMRSVLIDFVRGELVKARKQRDEL